MPNITRPQEYQIVKTKDENAPVSSLLGFLDPDALAGALEQSGWTVRKRIERLMEIAEQDGNLNAALQAIKMMDQTALDALVAHGALQKLTESTSGTVGDVRVQVERTGLRVQGSPLGRTTAEMLNQAFQVMDGETDLDEPPMLEGEFTVEETLDPEDEDDDERECGGDGTEDDSAEYQLGTPGGAEGCPEWGDDDSEAPDCSPRIRRPTRNPRGPRLAGGKGGGKHGAKRPTRAVVGGGLCGEYDLASGSETAESPG